MLVAIPIDVSLGVLRCELMPAQTEFLVVQVVALLRGHVFGIVFIRAYKQMRRVPAATLVAGMADLLLTRQIHLVREHIDHAVP